MIRPQLGDNASVPEWGIRGRIVSIMTKLHGRTQYLVRYQDAKAPGPIFEQWFYLEDFMNDPASVHKIRKEKLAAVEDEVLKAIAGEVG